MKNLRNYLFSILLFFIFGEIAARFVVPILTTKKPPFDTAIKDEKLGWLPKADYQFDGEMRNVKGETYPLHLTSTKHGFRTWDVNGADTLSKILFIGDSFTQAVEVSDDKTFFHHLGAQLPARIYAFGMAGYGTYQQLQILEKHIEEIQPDLIVLQFCSNDFIDNHEYLEQHGNYYVGLRRPYMNLNGEVNYRIPTSKTDQILSYSAFYRLLKHYWIVNRGRNPDHTKSSEHIMSEQGLAYAPFAESVQRTDLIIEKFKKTAGDAPILAFSSDQYEPHYQEFWKICSKHQIHFADEINHRLNEARDTSIIFAYDGFHWNENGHAVAAKALVAPIEQLIK